MNMSKNLFETQNFNSLKEALKDIKPSDSQSTDRSPVNQTFMQKFMRLCVTRAIIQ